MFPNTVQPDETLYSEPEESAQHTAQWEQPHPTEHITEAEEVPSHIDHVPLSQTGHFHVDTLKATARLQFRQKRCSHEHPHWKAAEKEPVFSAL